MRKLLVRGAIAAGALLALAALALAAASLPWTPATRRGAPALERVARGSGALRAGAAAVPIAVPEGAPVAGFARLRWRAEGVRDPVAVRALVLQEPGCRVALVSVELLLVPGDLQRAIARAVADLGLDAVVVAATHTHAGPGGFWKDALAERLGAGPYDPRSRAALERAAVEAVRRAAAALRPAALVVARGAATELAGSRSGGAVDARLLDLRLLGEDGAAIAEVVAFPAHPTLVGRGERRISGDWPGALARGAPWPLLVLQGAVGDQRARLPEAAAVGPEAYAAALGAAVARLRAGPADRAPALAVARAWATLPAVTPGAVPTLLRPAARNLLGGELPERASVTALRLGALTLLAVPGEPVATVGAGWRAAAGEGAEVVALADDYVGYVETAERTARGAGEARRTWYGPELEERLGAALAATREAVADPGPASATRDQNRATGTAGAVGGASVQAR